MKTPQWIVSDTHFGHANILRFEAASGGPMRPFSSTEEMDEAMVERWNARVRPQDVVLHLGDVSMDYERLGGIMARLNGRIGLVPGNHDRILDPRLMDHFEWAAIWAVLGDHGMMCSHMPLMRSCFAHKAKVNVHGHTHDRPGETPEHVNACVERTGYAPVHVDELAVP